MAVKDRIYYKVSVVHVRTNCKYCKTMCTWERRASHGEIVYYPKYGAEQEIRDNPNKQNLATSPSEEGQGKFFVLEKISNYSDMCIILRLDILISV